MERKRTKAEERAHSELLLELSELDVWMEQFRKKEDLIPEDWSEVEAAAPVIRKKEKVTLSVDADLLRWFRAMGRGYQGRVNAVLRIYMLSVLSKEVRLRADIDWKGESI